MGRGAYQAWGYEGENSGVTRDEFEAVAGDIDEYEDDALERANCHKAGQVGHRACGLC